MTTQLKPFAAVAAVLVVAVVGLEPPPGSRREAVLRHRVQADAEPDGDGPSAAPTGTPYACEGETTGCAGPLAPGDHAAANFLLGLTFATPDGWVNVRDIRRTYGLDEPTGLAAKIEVMGLNAIADQTEACGPVAKAGVGYLGPGLHHGRPDPSGARGDGSGRRRRWTGSRVNRSISPSRRAGATMCPDIDL